MGLEMVEIVMATEEAFNIELPDESVSQVSTVNEYYKLICSHIEMQKGEGCLTRSVFFRLRRAINEVLPQKQRIKPSSPLNEVLPVKDRPEMWEKIKKVLGDDKYGFPELCRPEWVLSSSALFLLVALAHWLVGKIFYQPPYNGWWLVLGVIISINFVSLVTVGIKRHFQPHIKTVGDLTQKIISYNFKQFSEECEVFNDENVYHTLCEIICEQLGIKMDQIKPDSRFIEDLGCG